MSGGLAACWTKIRVAKPKVVTSSARTMGVKARWVTLSTQILEDPLYLVLGVELVALYGALVGILDLRLFETRLAPLLIEFDPEWGVRHAPVGHHLPLVELEEVPAGPPEVSRRQGEDYDQNDRQPAHEISQRFPWTPRALPAPGPGRPAWAATVALAPGWRADVRALPCGSQGEHLAGGAGASRPPFSRVRLLWQLLHINDDDGDVVVAAGVEGRREEAARRLLRVLLGLGQDLRDPGLRDHIREPVRTEQDAVARLDGHNGGVDFDLLLSAEGAGDEVLLGVLSGLVSGQVTASHQLGDKRVVLCHRLHLAATHEVGPRVADVRHLGHRFPLRPAEPYGDHGSTHPRELLVAAARGHYPTVRLSYGRFKGFVWLKIFERFHGDGAGDLPGLEAAYAVGDDEERLVLTIADEQGVLVVLAHLASIGDAERLQLEERHVLLLLVPEGGRADPDGVPVPQGRGAHGLAPVHEGPVRRVEVLDVEQSPVPGELGVAPRGVVVAL